MAHLELYLSDLFDEATLKAYYRFESGALTTDSKDSHTLTAISVPTEDASGEFGGAVSFAGDDAYSAVDHADFKPTGNFSVGAWVKNSGSGTNQYFFWSASINTNWAGIGMYIAATTGLVTAWSGKNTGTVSGTDFKTVSSTSSVTDGAWHFVVFTWDGIHLKLYIDSTQEGGDVDWTDAPVYAATNYVRFGCRCSAGTNASWFTGSLDDSFIYNGKALTNGEVLSLWSTLLGLSDSLDITEGLATESEFHLSKTDAQSITARITSAGLPVHWEDATPNKFNLVKFIWTKFGLNVHAGEDIPAESTRLLRKYNDCWLFELDDSILISEGVTTFHECKLLLYDSINIVESTAKDVSSVLSDNLPIAVQVGNDIGLRLSDSITIATSLIEISLVEGKSLKTAWRFLIRTKTGQYVASLVNARGRWFKEALNHGGSAGFILDTTDANCNSTILAVNSNELIIQYKGYDMFGGQISSIRKVADGNNRYWEVSAIQFFNLLEQRFCGYNKSTGLSQARTFTTTDAGTIAWTLIDEAQDEVNGSLGITQGTLQASLNRTKSYEKKNIAEAIVELADNDYGFDFEITTDKVFNVYYPMKGEVRDEVIFRYPGNCLNMECLENGLDIVNSELGLGRNWGGEEIYYIVDDVASQITYGKREKIASYKDMELQAYLTDMVTEDVAWNKNLNKVIKFKSFIDSKTDLYRYELGDSVRVVADDFDIDEQLFVYERQVTVDEADNATVSLTLGD